MKRNIFLTGLILIATLFLTSGHLQSKPARVLVITGGHDYQQEPFNQMLLSLGKLFICEVISFPETFSGFLPENRDRYDVLVFYHMWQNIIEGEAKNFSECIREGKPLVVLHHSICAFDNWPEYINIIGWTKKYGKAQVVTLQSGHDTHTFKNLNFRKLL